MSKRIIWVWESEWDGLVLFHGNPNPDCPPYHASDVSGWLRGKDIVWGHTKWELENKFDKTAWRRRFPQYKVKPRKVTIEIKPYVKKAR